MNRQRIAAFFWTLLLAAFVALGVCSVAGRLDLRAPRISAPLDGIDGAQRILENSAKIKPGAPVLVVGPGDSVAFCQTFFSISYLLWPHRVWELGKVAPGKVPLYNLMPAQQLKPAAMFLFRLQPPPELAADSQQTAPGLTTVFIPKNNQ
jgi:hypothetical protein